MTKTKRMAGGKKPKQILVGVLLGVALVAGAVGYGFLGKKAIPPVAGIHGILTGSGKEAPVWFNTSRALRSEDLRGRILLLDFWTYACVNCMHVVPELQALEEKFGNRLTVIGIHSAKFSREKKDPAIRAAIERLGVGHPVLNDGEFAVWKELDVHAWPTLILFDPSGKEVKRYSGEGHGEQLKKQISDLIAQWDSQINSDPLPIRLEDRGAAVGDVLKFPGKFLPVTKNGQLETLYLSDSGNHRVLGIRSTGQIFLNVGTRGVPGWRDGTFQSAQFRDPQGLALLGDDLYVADRGNHRIRKIDLKKGEVTTVAGTGKRGPVLGFQQVPAVSTGLASPWDLAVRGTHELWVAQAGTHQILDLNLSKGTVRAWAGSGREGIVDGDPFHAQLAQPSGLSPGANKLYFMDAESSALRVAGPQGGVTTLVGKGLFEFGRVDGKKDVARMQHPLGLAWSSKGVHVADTFNHAIRFYSFATQSLRTVFGDRPNEKDRLSEPSDLFLLGEKIYVLDTNHHLIRILDPKSRTLRTFEVLEPAPPEHRHLAKKLPNLVQGPAQTVSLKEGISLQVVLPAGWEINDLAPTWMALFPEGSDLSERELNTQDLRTSLKQRWTVSKEGKYLMQGTLYYCEKKKKNICVLKSWSQEIRVDSSRDHSDLIQVSLE